MTNTESDCFHSLDSVFFCLPKIRNIQLRQVLLEINRDIIQLLIVFSLSLNNNFYENVEKVLIKINKLIR